MKLHEFMNQFLFLSGIMDMRNTYSSSTRSYSSLIVWMLCIHGTRVVVIVDCESYY